MLSSPSSLCASIRACSTRPCCSLATNQNHFQSFLDWNNWSTPGYLDPFETRLSKVKVKEKPPHQQPPAAAAAAAAREVPQQQLPQSTSSTTSLFSTSSWFSSGDDSFEYSPMASPPTPPPTLTPTNPFLPYLLSTSSSEAALATVPEEEPSSSSLFYSYEPQDTTESRPETLNASYNPFFTWSKFTSLELLQLRCLALCFVVASSVWIIVQLSASI